MIAGPRSGERLVDRLARGAVVQHRPAHRLDRLLGAVHRRRVLVAARDRPERRLLAVAVPVRLALVADRVPARLVLPVVVAAAEHQPLLGPDDLAADREAAGVEAVGDGGGVQRPVPDVGDLAGKQRPGLAPVGPVVVQHLAGAPGRGGARPVAPGRVVGHAIGRIGRHQMRPHPAEQPRHVGGIGGAAAEQPVAAEQPEVAGPRDRHRRRLGRRLLARVGGGGVRAARRSRRPRSRARRGRRPAPRGRRPRAPASPCPSRRPRRAGCRRGRRRASGSR